MFRSRIRLLAAAAVMSVLVIPPLGAHGRPSLGSIVRDGFYAGMDSRSGALVFFHVKHRRVYHLRFSLDLTCRDSSTGQDYPANFGAGSRMPQGRLIPANGTLRINWIQENGARHGHIDAELSFRRHWLASFSVLSAGSVEDCNGFSAVLLQRARRTPPVPHAP